MKILMNPGAYHSRFISKRTESLLCRTVLTEAQVLSELAGHRRVTRSLRATGSGTRVVSVSKVCAMASN